MTEHRPTGPPEPPLRLTAPHTALHSRPSTRDRCPRRYVPAARRGRPAGLSPGRTCSATTREHLRCRRWVRVDRRRRPPPLARPGRRRQAHPPAPGPNCGDAFGLEDSAHGGGRVRRGAPGRPRAVRDRTAGPAGPIHRGVCGPEHGARHPAVGNRRRGRVGPPARRDRGGGRSSRCGHRRCGRPGALPIGEHGGEVHRGVVGRRCCGPERRDRGRRGGADEEFGVLPAQTQVEQDACGIRWFQGARVRADFDDPGATRRPGDVRRHAERQGVIPQQGIGARGASRRRWRGHRRGAPDGCRPVR